MAEYKDYCLGIELLSATGTPWQSDTVLGHLAWCVALKEGESGVRRFLEPFIKREPPFVISDGFPEGLLPRPLFPAEKQRERMTAEESATAKKLRKAQFVGPESFARLTRGENHVADAVQSPWRPFKMIHAVIDRTTFSTEGAGNIFPTVSEALSEDNPRLSIYIRSRDGHLEQVARLFRDLASMGYGRDKSTGSGEFRVAGLSEWDMFSDFEGADGFVSLSSWVPAADDPTSGFWKLNVKRGKLGDGAGSGNPFKKPLIQFAPGSAFITGSRPKPWYGRAVPGLAPAMPEAVQLCYCLAVPCRFPQSDRAGDL